ncbi:MAG: type IV pilin [Haloarculaceae archaeon]
MNRGQSHVVGVVLLLGLTVAALGGLTAVTGEVVDGQTAAADEARVASSLAATLRPVEQTGHNTGRVQFTAGRLTTADREVRVRRSGRTVWTADTGALVYHAAEARAAFVAGGVVRGRPGAAWTVRDLPVTATRDTDAIVLGVARLGASDVTVSGSRGSTVTLKTNVSHDRRRLSSGSYTVAIETATPDAFARSLDTPNRTTRVRDLDGDGTASAVVQFDGRRTLYLVVHEMRLEVGHG